MRTLFVAMLLFVPVSDASLNPPLSAETVEVPVEEIERIRMILLQQQMKINELQQGVEMWQRAAKKFRCA